MSTNNKAYATYWRATNRDHLRKYKRSWQRKNRKRTNSYQAAWRDANPDKVKANSAKYYQSNKAAILQRAKARKEARKLNGGVKQQGIELIKQQNAETVFTRRQNQERRITEALAMEAKRHEQAVEQMGSVCDCCENKKKHRNWC